MANIDVKKLFELLGKAVYESEVLYDQVGNLTKRIDEIEIKANDKERLAEEGKKPLKKTG